MNLAALFAGGSPLGMSAALLGQSDCARQRNFVLENVKSRKRRRHWLRQIRRAEFSRISASAMELFEGVSCLATATVGFMVAGRLMRRLAKGGVL
jgi:hypothetical protein